MYATIDGIPMHYAIAGRGIPCLVPSLAGTPIYERTFSSPALLEHLRLIFVELRANRTPVGDPGRITLDAVVDDMDRLRGALGLARVAVLGHSDHGILALAYAARYPERASRVIAVGARPALSDAIMERTATYWDLVASPDRKRILAENQAALDDEVLDQLTPSGRAIAQYAASGPLFFHDPGYDSTPLWAGHDDLSPALFERFWGPGGQFRAFEPDVALPRVRCPVFIAQGVFDFDSPPVVWDGAIEKFPDATYRAFERSGHYPQMEERELFDAKLLDWLGAP